MQFKVFLLFGLVIIIGFLACSNPIATETKSGNLSRTEYAAYSSRNEIYDPAWSPDGERIAFVWRSSAMDAYKMSARGDTLGLIKRYYERIDASKWAISPNEQYILYCDNNYNSDTQKTNCFLYSIAQDSNILFNDFLPSNISMFKWSWDGQLIYYLHNENSSYTINAITLDGAPVFSVPLDSMDYIVDYSVSPDNQFIVWCGRTSGEQFYQLWYYAPESGQQLLFADNSINYFRPSWSPDGNNFAYSSYDSKLRLYSINLYSQIKKETCTLVDSLYSLSSDFGWTGDGQTIFFQGRFYENDELKYGICKITITDSSITFLNNYEGSSVVRIMPDGSFYILSNNTQSIYRIYTYNPVTRATSILIPDSWHSLASPAWSPDGANLVFTYGGKLARIPGTGGSIKALTIDGTNKNDCYHPDYSPDGTLLVFDDRYYIYSVSANGGTANMLVTQSNYTNPVWSPDGKQIACAYSYNYDDSLMVFDYNDGNLTRSQAWPGKIIDLSWSKSNPLFGSHLLFSALQNPKDRYGPNELKAINPQNGQLLNFLGLKGSISWIPRSTITTCWSPDAESIAWIDYFYVNRNYNYNLNIAHVFINLQKN